MISQFSEINGISNQRIIAQPTPDGCPEEIYDLMLDCWQNSDTFLIQNLNYCKEFNYKLNLKIKQILFKIKIIFEFLINHKNINNLLKLQNIPVRKA